MNLTDHLVDYAGLFPPASLSMTQAVAEYRDAVATPQGILLGPFVVPLDRLSDLDDAGGSDLPVSILVRGTGADVALGIAGVSQYDIRAYEVRLDDGLTDATAVLEAADRCPVYFEIDPTSAHDLDHLAMLEGSFPGRVGAKFRTGGLDLEDIPPADALAAGVIGAVRRKVRFKATAGLHHPVRGIDPQRGFETHGFLNLAVATLARDEQSATEILLDSDPDHFSADPWRYRDHELGPAVLDRIRDSLRSFGCCSFRDPVDGLTALGWSP